MTITARWYQDEAIEAIYNYFMSKSGNPLIGLPGGTGKSIIPAIFIHKVMKHWPYQRFLLITHIKELISQNAEKLLNVWPTAPLGIHSAGLKQRDTIQPIIYGGIQSMIKKPTLFGHRDLIFIDEAHLVNQDESSMYQTFIALMKLINPSVKIVGMTATPFRMGQGMLTDNGLFTDLIYDMTDTDGFNKLLEQGYLSPLVPFKTNVEIDTSNISVNNGEFVASQLQAASDKQEITYKALQEITRAGENRKSWLLFASGIEHAEHIAEMMQTFGIECAAVHSKQKSEYNDLAIQQFKEGKLRSIVNYGKLTTGFDHPPIDLIGDLRPTLSIPLHIQKYCRGTRPAPDKKNCIVLDFSRNTPRLGPINAPVIPRKKGEGQGDAPVKICDNCGAYNFASVRFCCNCGNEFEFKIKIFSKPGTEELIKNDLPIIEDFEVQYVTYVRKQKPDKNPYIEVTYFTGLQSFKEFIFPENTKFTHPFRQWWRTRHHIDPPTKTDEALKYISELRKPKTIRVHCNKKYPEILSATWMTKEEFEEHGSNPNNWKG